MEVPHLYVARTPSGLDIPRPFRAGLTVAAVGVLPLVAGAAGASRLLSALAFAAMFGAAGALQAFLAHHELTGLRRQADGELRRGRRPYFHPALVSWRSSELLSAQHRKSVARMVVRTEHDLSPSTLPNASPLNRVAARPHVDLFDAIAERLAAVDHPVEPHAILLVEDLLTSAGSPLYERERAGELRASLLACIDALDAPSAPVPAAAQRQIPAGGHSELRLPATTSAAATASVCGMAHSRDRTGSH